MNKPAADQESMRIAATAVVKHLQDSGHEGWFVGGCVREMQLGLEPADYDVTTDALPDRVEELFSHVVEVGRAFGVMTVIQDGVHVEVATFRTEDSYSDGRRPDRVEFASAEEDVLRRDFTMNGLLYDPIKKILADHVGGRADLAAGLVRTVGDPEERFAEDHLRLLRAVRFTARLGFRLEPATREAVKRLAPLAAKVSAERLRDELSRMLLHPSRGIAFALLDDLGLLEVVLPEVAFARSAMPASPSLPDFLKALPPDASFACVWATVAADLGAAPDAESGELPPAEGMTDRGAAAAALLAERLRFSRAQAKRTAELVRRQHELAGSADWRPSRRRRLFADEIFDDLSEFTSTRGRVGGDSLDAADSLVAERQALGAERKLPAPFLDGSDLRETGLAPGPRYAEILRELFDEQLDGDLCDRPAALQRLRSLTADDDRE
jgi:tRNA nucleotidyltransferase/poly(A) polymerase